MFIKNLFSIDSIKEVLTPDRKQSLENKIKGIAFDSRKVKKDFLFICIKGLSRDSHDYIETICDKGCNCIIIEYLNDKIKKLIEKYKKVIFFLSSNTRETLAESSHMFYEYPCNDVFIIGITGTNGKTTISQIIKNIFEKTGISSGVIGTLGYFYKNIEKKLANTTPESLTLLEIIKEMKDAGVKIIAMEVSSHGIDLKRIHGFEFDICIFSNLTSDHLDYHKTLENYYLAKKKLFTSSLKNRIKKNKIIINIDNKFGNRLFNELKNNLDLITVSCKTKEAAIFVENIKFLEFTEFFLKTKNNNILIKSPLFGFFNIYNMMLAIGACLSYGLPEDQIRSSIKFIKQVPGRFELVENNQNLKIVVDYAHTEDALKNILTSCRKIVNKRIITIFGCGGDRDKTKRPKMGKIVETLSDFFIITSDNPRSESPESIINDITNGLDPKNSDYLIETDREKAIKKGIDLLTEDDILVVAGKGHEDYQIFKDKTIWFDDREIAKKYINLKAKNNGSC